MVFSNRRNEFNYVLHPLRSLPAAVNAVFRHATDHWSSSRFYRGSGIRLSARRRRLGCRALSNLEPRTATAEIEIEHNGGLCLLFKQVQFALPVGQGPSTSAPTPRRAAFFRSGPVRPAAPRTWVQTLRRRTSSFRMLSGTAKSDVFEVRSYVRTLPTADYSRHDREPVAECAPVADVRESH